MRHCSTYVIWRSLQPSRPSNIVKILSWRRFSNTSRQSEGVETLLDLLQDTGKDVRNELRWSRIKEQLERRAQIPQNLKVRRPLPLSPLMDPSNIAARQKYKTTKYPGNKDLTPFQRKLAMNPYGKLEPL